MVRRGISLTRVKLSILGRRLRRFKRETGLTWFISWETWDSLHNAVRRTQWEKGNDECCWGSGSILDEDRREKVDKSGRYPRNWYTHSLPFFSWFLGLFSSLSFSFHSFFHSSLFFWLPWQIVFTQIHKTHSSGVLLFPSFACDREIYRLYEKNQA